MIKRLLVYFALIAVALVSCTRKDMEDVPVIIMPSQFSETGFEQAVSSIELTELSSERLLGGVLDMIVHDGEYVFADKRSGIISRYSSDGAFMNEIGHRGNGPKEYVDIRNIQNYDGNLIVYSSPDKAICFDYDGTFLWSEENLFGNQNYRLGDSYLAYYGYLTKGEPRLAVVKDKRVEKKYLVSENQVLPLNKIAPVFSKTDEGISVIDSYNNVLYLLSDGGLRPYIQFDFGQNSIDPSFYEYEDLLKGAMNLMSSPFAVISSYYESSGRKMAEIDIQGPDSMKKVYAYCRNGEWNWFSCGDMGENPFAGGFKGIDEQYAYFLLDPSLADKIDDGLKVKISNPQVLQGLTADGNYVIAKVIFN